MRQLKKWCAGILAGLFAVTLAGCAAVPGQQETTGDNTVQSLTGGYLEEDISPDHNDNVGLYAVGDVLHAVTIENAAAPLQQQIAHWYTMGPDGSWQENEANGFADAAAQVPEASAALCNAYLAQDGSLYWRITVIREEPEKTSQSYLFAVQDGKARLLDTPPVGEVSLWMDDTTTALAVCGDTILVTDNTMEPHAYDNQGNPVPMKFPDMQGRLLCGAAVGITANREKMHHNLHNSLMLVTALNPYIGYENAAKTAKKAYKDNISLKEACVQLGFLTAERFDEVFHPEQMV